MSLDAEQRSNVARFLRIASEYVVEDALLMLKEGVERGGFQTIIMSDYDEDEMVAALYAEDAARWLKLVAAAHRGRDGKCREEDIAVLDCELREALKEALSVLREHWYQLTNIGLAHRHEVDAGFSGSVRIDSWVFDKLQEDIVCGRDVLFSIGEKLEDLYSWEDWPHERAELLRDDDVAYVGTRPEVDHYTPPWGVRGFGFERRWNGSVRKIE